MRASVRRRWPAAPTGPGPGAARSVKICSSRIPDPPPGFPTDEVTLRLIDSDDTKTPYWKALFAAYQAKFPQLTCSYDGLPWNRIDEIVPLGFRNGRPTT